MYSRVLVPLDGTHLAETILPHAIDIARRFDATLVVLRALTAIEDIGRETAVGEPFAAAPIGVDLTQEVIEDEREAARRYLADVGRRLQAEGVRVEAFMQEGDPALVLPAAVKGQRADLVAMATHGRTSLGRLVFGSVAESVLHEVNVPMLLLHARE
jgi:nucleotide-binding universal stress UspA family protein